MTNPTIRIHDLETNEVIDREMTADELVQYNAEQAEAKTRRDAEAAKAADKAALLSKLGITEDEARLLLGGN